MRGEWLSDEDSQSEACIALLAATFVSAGMDVDESVDAAASAVAGGMRIVWDGSSLTFEPAANRDEP
jgi:hypothetical protein